MIRLILTIPLLTLLTSCSEPAEQPPRAALDPPRRTVSPQPRICSLHHVPMEREAVMVVLGEPDIRSPYYQATQQYFPNANMVAFSETGSAESHLVDYCPKCREARDAWLMKNSGRMRVMKGD